MVAAVGPAAAAGLGWLAAAWAAGPAATPPAQASTLASTASPGRFAAARHLGGEDGLSWCIVSSSWCSGCCLIPGVLSEGGR
jgi:hypothetical protein